MAPALEDGSKVEDGPCHRKWSGGGPMGSFGRSAAFLERTGLGGSGGFQLAALPGFGPAAVGCRGGVMARLVKSMPPTGGGSGGVLGPGTSGAGVSGTSSVALGGHGVSGVVCGVSGGLVGMAGGCTVGGRVGGYLSLGGASGVGFWAGAAVSVVGGALLGSCGAWTSRTAVLGFELLALVLGPKETGGPVGALGTAAAWKLGGGP